MPRHCPNADIMVRRQTLASLPSTSMMRLEPNAADDVDRQIFARIFANDRQTFHLLPVGDKLVVRSTYHNYPPSDIAWTGRFP